MTRNILSYFILLASLFMCVDANCQSSQKLIKGNFEFAAKQLDYALSEMKNAIENESDSSIHVRNMNGWSELTNPRSVEEGGTLMMVPSKDWCSGFFPGELWYMYEYTKDNKWKELAHHQTIIIEREKKNDRTHDMGFKMYCSYGNGLRLTGDAEYKKVLLESASTLLKRFNTNVGTIKSWDFGSDRWSHPVLIDNMLHLALFFWASNPPRDSTFYNAAVSHAMVTMKNHFREDCSCYHVVDYDNETGEIRRKMTWQGYSDESAWARGQAWALYGYTMCYRETGNNAFLEHAKMISKYIFTHPNMPEDLIPYWDFNAPEIPNEPRDVSAATCIASALYELSMYDKENAKQHIRHANTILESVTKSYRAKLNTEGGFLLLSSTGSKQSNLEVARPLVYADYYFLEALLRKQKIDSNKH